MPSRWSRIALGTGLALAVASALALWDSRFHVVPLVTGGTWRGVSDPPTAARVWLALACGVVAGWGLSRTPAVARPLLAPGLAAAPLIPIATGALVSLLTFQGPVLILVTGAALAVAFARAQPSSAAGRVPGWLWFAAPFVFYVTLAGRVPGAAGPQGDEPHYLAMAHSLWSDGDLDLTDEFADREYAAFFPGQLEPHTSPSSPPGRLYSLHSPGLPLIILPGYALCGFFGVQVELAAMAALIAWLVHRTVRDACGDGAAVLAWGLLAFTPPLPIFAVSVYPELPAALGTAVLLRVCQGRRPHPASTVAAALLAGLLPWLHSKFLPLGAAGLLFVILRPMTRRFQVAAVVTFAAAVLALLLLFDRLYGQATLSAAFGPPDIDLRRLPWGVAAMLLDRQFGLIAWSPAWLLAFVGWPMLLRQRPGDAVRGAVLAAIPLVVGGTFATWWGGASPPARFILPALPALALALAPAARLRPYLAAGLGGLGLALLGFAADAPRVLHNRTDGESLLLRNLNPSLDLNSFLPSFFDPAIATAVVAVSVVAAAALAWRFRARGALIGLAGWLLVAGAVRTRPLVDPRLAVEDVLDAWEPGHWAGPAGPPRLQALALTFELQKGPWVLAAGESRNSRRVTLYPGDYRVELRARAAGSGSFAMRVVLGTGEMDLAEAVLTDAQPAVVWPLLLPAGARGLGLNAAAVSGRGELEEVKIVPVALVPRGERGRFAWPTFALGDRYRVGDPIVRATALDRSVPDAGGFRIAASGDRFLVDGPPAVAVQVRVRPAQGAPVVVVWGDRRVDLSNAPGEQALTVPLSAGRDLGRASVVPVSVEAPPGTWVGFFGATGAP